MNSPRHNTPRSIALMLFNTTMKVTYEERKHAFIWAAKHRVCPTCKAEAYQPCLNLTLLKRAQKSPVQVPHEERIDWYRLVMGLRDRGYISEGLYLSTLQQMREAE